MSDNNSIVIEQLLMADFKVVDYGDREVAICQGRYTIVIESECIPHLIDALNKITSIQTQ